MKQPSPPKLTRSEKSLFPYARAFHVNFRAKEKAPRIAKTLNLHRHRPQKSVSPTEERKGESLNEWQKQT